MCRTRTIGGWITIEIITGLIILASVSAALAVAMNASGKLNRIQLTRQRCLAAAAAELDCLTTTGEPIAPEDFARLWPGLEVRIRQQNGSGQWSGLKLTKVAVTGKVKKKEVNVELSRYLIAGQE